MPPTDLSLNLAGLALKNPVMTASGTFGWGVEYEDFLDLSGLGAIVVKATTLHPRPGNPPPRVTETPAGMLNAIGLQNPGVEAVIAEKLPPLQRLGTPVIVNIAGDSLADYAAVAGRLTESGLCDALEVNASCPNCEQGGMLFGLEPAALAELVRAVRAATDLPLITKLSPNVTDIVPLAAAAVAAGSDALSLINTLVGIAIDVEQRLPKLGNITGGLSGPAIRPVAVRMVWQVAAAGLGVPIIGMGGIMNARDALEFLLAGAHAVAIGTGTFVTPETCMEVVAGLEEYGTRHGVTRLQELVGAARNT
ncbi:MAG: dihydroorotate dehydrogenase [Armatimonadetes bacterium]|nr:dihydroorotate dehydrogenase [Armatimonadota bacterium]